MGCYFPSWSYCSKALYKPVWHIPLPSVQWTNSWWWAEELSESCRVSRQNKFVKLVHLVGFIIKKFVTMHGHMNVKKVCLYVSTVKWSSSKIKFAKSAMGDQVEIPVFRVTNCNFSKMCYIFKRLRITWTTSKWDGEKFFRAVKWFITLEISFGMWEPYCV